VELLGSVAMHIDNLDFRRRNAREIKGIRQRQPVGRL
jgi:hypothetical protein